VSLASALEQAAEALPEYADVIRPANGDPERVLQGLDVESARQVLQWLLENVPGDGGELAAAWAELEAGSVVVAALDPEAFPKPARKALRRAFHRLRSRGVALPEREVAPSVAKLPQLEDDLGGAFLSVPDPSGAQLAVRVERNPAGGARILQGAFDWERGVLDFRVFEVNRSQARALLRDIAASAREGFAPVAPALWARVLDRACEAQPADRPAPAAFIEWRGRLVRESEVAELPGDEARAALVPQEDSAALRELTEWIGEGRVGPWPPSAAELEAFGRRVRETLESKLLVDDGQRRRQLDALLGDLAEERYRAERGDATARRLETLAYIFWKKEKLDEARIYLSGADAFKELSPKLNPIARALLGKSLEPLLKAWKQEDERSLLVRP
jgi:hypothetical protein